MLHQHVLKALPDIPWIDHTRVAAFGFRFGANVAVRLAYLESPRLKAVACLGPVVHSLLTDSQRLSGVPEMYLDVLASCLGMHDASDEALRVELNRYSLKTQGLLGRRCPTPMLSGFWKNDPFSPEEESRLIASSSADGKLLEIPFKPVYRNFDKSLQEITAWVKHRLR
ncbi:esterase [Pseudescherichia vulneris]|nr:alpha/beta hydrolase [Pseudescherichia vulneris]STQ58538.1 esterase [Pseudescherichia vulneris]